MKALNCVRVLAVSTITILLAGLLPCTVLAGDLLVSDESGNAIRRFDEQTGAPNGIFATLSSPEAMAINPNDGNVYVASFLSSRILCFDPSGTPCGVFVDSGVGGLSGPVGLTFGPDNNLYVGSRGTANVLRYDGITGGFIDVFASGNGLSGPDALTFGGPNGDLYVSSRFNSKVLEYDGVTGIFVQEVASGAPLSTPEGLADDGIGNLFVVNRGANQVLVYDETSLAVSIFARDHLNVPIGITFGANGDLLVVNFGDRNVVEFDGGGIFVRTFVAAGTLSGPTFLMFLP